MRAFVLALVLWSAVVLIWILFVPNDNTGLLGCMHLVGRSVACETQQDAINQVLWNYQTLPSVITIAAGYVGIVILRLAGFRRERPDLASQTADYSLPPVGAAARRRRSALSIAQIASGRR